MCDNCKSNCITVICSRCGKKLCSDCIQIESHSCLPIEKNWKNYGYWQQKLRC